MLHCREGESTAHGNSKLPHVRNIWQLLAGSIRSKLKRSFLPSPSTRLAILIEVLLISFDTVFAQGEKYLSGGHGKNSIFHFRYLKLKQKSPLKWPETHFSFFLFREKAEWEKCLKKHLNSRRKFQFIFSRTK